MTSRVGRLAGPDASITTATSSAAWMATDQASVGVRPSVARVRITMTSLTDSFIGPGGR